MYQSSMWDHIKALKKSKMATSVVQMNYFHSFKYQQNENETQWSHFIQAEENKVQSPIRYCHESVCCTCNFGMSCS